MFQVISLNQIFLPQKTETYNSERDGTPFMVGKNKTSHWRRGKHDAVNLESFDFQRLGFGVP